MATTGFWPVKARLKEVIDYAENPDKTTDKKFLDEDLWAALRYVENDDKTDQTMYVSGTFMAQELNKVRKKLLSFAEYAKDAQPEELVNLIATVVERINITTENDKRICHIFVKGCTTEDYTDLFGGTTDYISIEKNPLKFNMCDSDKCSEVNTFKPRYIALRNCLSSIYFSAFFCFFTSTNRDYC